MYSIVVANDENVIDMTDICPKSPVVTWIDIIYIMLQNIPSSRAFTTGSAIYYYLFCDSTWRLIIEKIVLSHVGRWKFWGCRQSGVYLPIFWIPWGSRRPALNGQSSQVRLAIDVVVNKPSKYIFHNKRNHNNRYGSITIRAEMIAMIFLRNMRMDRGCIYYSFGFRSALNAIFETSMAKIVYSYGFHEILLQYPIVFVWLSSAVAPYRERGKTHTKKEVVVSRLS